MSVPYTDSRPGRPPVSHSDPRTGKTCAGLKDRRARLLLSFISTVCPNSNVGLTKFEGSCPRIKPECYTHPMATLGTHSQLAVWGSATEEDGNGSANPRPAEPRSSSRDFPPVYSRDQKTGDGDNGSSKPLPQESQPLKAPTTPDTPSTEHPPAYSEAVRASGESNHGQEHQPVIPDLKKISSMTIKEILAQLGGWSQAQAVYHPRRSLGGQHGH